MSGSTESGDARQAAPWKERLGGLYSRHRRLFAALGVLLAVAAALLVYDALQPEPQRLTQEHIDAAVGRTLESLPPEPSLASTAYQIIRPSLVVIQGLGSSSRAEEELAPEQAPGPDENSGGREEGEFSGSLGTGVVIVDDGTILTCLHVVGGADAVRVIFADGSESEAEVIVRQPENDLAVLRALIIPDDLAPATLAASAMLRVGDEVAAVGHPFGISGSLSAGVVSGLGRNYLWPDTGRTLTNLIQFDAAVNPGNSGGPLVNRDGEVVGIVTALLNPTGQDFFIGIGFAVPIETASAAAGPPVW